MKELISARVIEDAAKNGTSYVTEDANTIVTPEARSVAQQLGVKIVFDNVNAASSSISNSSLRDEIKRQVMKRLSNQKYSEADLERVIDKVLAERSPSSGISGNKVESYSSSPEVKTGRNFKYQNLDGIKRIDASSVVFQGAESAQLGAGLSDVVSSKDKSPMTVGYMSWDNSFYQWSPAHHEVNVVLEGQLHLRSGGKEIICKAGDAVYIPKGSALEVGTNSRVRFVYVICSDSVSGGK